MYWMKIDGVIKIYDNLFCKINTWGNYNEINEKKGLFTHIDMKFAPSRLININDKFFTIIECLNLNIFWFDLIRIGCLNSNNFVFIRFGWFIFLVLFYQTGLLKFKFFFSIFLFIWIFVHCNFLRLDYSNFILLALTARMIKKIV